MTEEWSQPFLRQFKNVNVILEVVKLIELI